MRIGNPGHVNCAQTDVTAHIVEWAVAVTELIQVDVVLRKGQRERRRVLTGAHCRNFMHNCYPAFHATASALNASGSRSSERSLSVRSSFPSSIIMSVSATWK